MIVCKGTRDGGVSWKRRSGLQMSILADEKGQFVRQFSFGRSLINIFRPDQLDLAKRSEGDFHKTFINDPLTDFYQMGGDVLLDKNGKILYYYHCSFMQNRPAESELLEIVRNEHKNTFVPIAEIPTIQRSKTCILL